MYKYSQIQEILQTVQQEFYYCYYKQSFDTGIISFELCSWYTYISVMIM